MLKKVDELLDSNYDGIEEYDNNLPRWWVNLFYGTILFGVAYTMYYVVLGLGDSPQQALEKQMAELHSVQQAIEAQKVKELGTSSSKLEKILSDATVIAQGKTVFDAKCASCHGALGQGLVGPNLTDEFWLHGFTAPEIQKTITEGVLEKGMLAWKGMITDDEINAVTAYVWSLYGTNPPGAKEPQGERHTR